MAIFVCIRTSILVMESATRKGRALHKSVDNSMAFFVYGGLINGEKKTRDNC